MKNKTSGAKTVPKKKLLRMFAIHRSDFLPTFNLLTSFYQLDDEARQEVVETIRLKLQYHRDPKRAEQIKQIKGW